MTKVAVNKASCYDPKKLADIISEALSEVGLFLPSDARILVKPNIVSQNFPVQCTTTHPSVIDALCMLLSDNRCSIIIGESSAFYQGGYTQRGFRTSGIADVARKYSAELVAFEEDGGVLVDNPKGVVLKQILMSKRVQEADYIISAGKLKTHSFAGMSATVKNIFGLIPGGTKYEYHFTSGYSRELFAEKIADLYALVRPDLYVLDAVRGLEGPGPAATGRPKDTGIVMVSDNGYALDYLAARMIGVDPAGYEILQAGIKRRFLPDPQQIVMTGDFDTLPSVPYKLPKKSEIRPREKVLLYQAVAVYPLAKKGKCTCCGICALRCPLQAIRIDGGAEIDLDACLKCYHCYYLCPEKAIVLKGLSRFNMAGRFFRRLLRI
ncbi:MAG: DUF362 domain-containing protein [Spirochaetales bacterium]|nr:DUF362 domain-containing protein [Spirochaetales bacterium]